MKYLIWMMWVLSGPVVWAGDLTAEFSTEPSPGIAGQPLTAELMYPNSGCEFLDTNETDIVHVAGQVVHVFMYLSDVCVDPYPLQLEPHSVALSGLDQGDYIINYYYWDANFPAPDVNNPPQPTWTFAFQMGSGPVAVNAISGMGLVLLMALFLWFVVRTKYA